MHHPIPKLLPLFVFFIALAANSAVIADFVQDRDLISLHYDHAPDRDDGHATVAALAVVRSLGIQPHVVSGAYGDGNRAQYQPAAEVVMNAAWGSAWVNAHGNWQAAVNATANSWLATLDSGGDIWIAEGGQADFTADVVRRIKTARASINTQNRINVVQHSIWNEQQANQADLNYTRANTNYVRIADGNGNNATADLNQKSPAFVNQARTSQFGSAWNAAFSYLNPNNKLDFSDTVELLHILQVGKNTVANVNDFAAVYINRSEIPQPGAPTVWSDSYSVNGQCYCDSTFDHGLSSITVNTPDGRKSVPEVCDDITARFGAGNFNNRVYYNTVQCGHGPANNAADELTCPGIPRAAGNYTGHRCQQTGATWNLDSVVPVVVEEVNQTSESNAAENNTPAIDSNTGEISFAECSTSVTDTDGDGYGWENNQTCIVSNAAFEPNTPAAAEVTTAEATTDNTIDLLTLFPACSSAAVDDNGDGYGWENNQTCVVSDAPSVTNTPVAAEATTDNTIDLLTLFPACSSSSVDDNGDGYGWENNQTCVVVNNAQPATSNVQPEITPAINSAPQFPACSDSATDTDGDGYAWENNQTCVITSSGGSSASVAPSNFSVDQTTTVQQQAPPANLAELLALFPVCSGTAIDFDNDGFAWENNQTCVIVPDSIQP